jgi:hypothetical protein
MKTHPYITAGLVVGKAVEPITSSTNFLQRRPRKTKTKTQLHGSGPSVHWQELPSELTSEIGGKEIRKRNTSSTSRPINLSRHLPQYSKFQSQEVFETLFEGDAKSQPKMAKRLVVRWARM